MIPIHFRLSDTLGLEYKDIILLVGLSILSTITEMFGLSIFLPIFQFIKNEGDIDVLLDSSVLWEYIEKSFSFFNLDISLVLLLLIAFTFFMSRQVLTYIRQVVRVKIIQQLNKRLCDSMFCSYLGSNTDYQDRHPVGDLVNAMTTEAKYAINGVMAPIDLLVVLLVAFGYLVLMLLLSWQMTVASLLILVLAIRFPKIWIKRSAEVGRSSAKANTKMSSFLVNRLKSPRIVRLAGTENAEQDEFERLTTAQRKYQIIGSILQIRTKLALEPIIIGLSLVFLYVAYTFLHMKIEMMGLYLVVVMRLMPTAKSAVVQWNIINRYLGSIESVKKRIQDMYCAKEVDSGIHKITQLETGFELDSVSYTYPFTSKSVLNNISFTIQPNTLNAIVGPSGGGKSTLIDLFLCLRNVDSGQIMLDDKPVDSYSLKSLRRFISYAAQTPQIFYGTIANHIRYGKVDATDEDIRVAANLAGADEFIETLENGYETFLTEDAINLSGGQRQRLDLARSLINKAPVLMLDEPSSNLDAESEEIFNKTLQRICEETDITVIIVSHRLANIASADQIIVLNQGVIEDKGCHAELMSRQGWYAKAWAIQQK